MDLSSYTSVTLNKKPPYFVSTEELLENMHFADIDRLPTFILAVGPVRSATTVTLRVFGESGIPAYSQPIKSLFRQLAKGLPGKSCSWLIPAADHVYLKETLGIFNAEESSINSIHILHTLINRSLATIYQGDELGKISLETLRRKVHVIIMGRHPFDTWYSVGKTYTRLMREVSEAERWYYETSAAELLDNFIFAYRWVARLEEYALQTGVPLTHFVAAANQQATEAWAALFKRLSIKSPPVVEGWTAKSLLGETGTNATTSYEQQTQQRAGIFDRVNRSTRIEVIPGLGDRLSTSTKETIRNARLLDIYDGWREKCEAELNIDLHQWN